MFDDLSLAANSSLFENRSGNQDMDNPEKPSTLGTQDTGRRQTKEKTQPQKNKTRSSNNVTMIQFVLSLS